MIENLIEMLLSIPGILFAFTLKGYAQALVAKKLGDPTPEAQGRLTMNPMAHIDIVGFICILIFQFGWCKPVMTNSRYYKNVKRDKTIQILSGPVGLLIGGFLMSFFAVLFTMLHRIKFTDNLVLEYLSSVFSYATMFPLFLSVFYLLPLPGLDGWNLITNFVPYRFNKIIFNIEKYSMYIFLAFVLLLNVTSLGIYIYMPVYWLLGKFEQLWVLILGFIF